jgi:CelD/BcsL family acetyltransferase involved in cellulose biosynthesis
VDDAQSLLTRQAHAADDRGVVGVPDWAALAEAQGNVFATPEWVETWLEHIGPQVGAHPHVFAAHDALVPLVVTRGRYVSKARFLGFGPANELGPLGVRGSEAVCEALDSIRGEWDLFLGEHLPGAGWAGRLGADGVRRDENRTVSGSWPSWDAYLASLSSNFRGRLRRDERRLARQGLEVRAVSSPDEIEGALDALFALHGARWGEEASIWFAGQEPFHRAFARRAADRGWARLYLLELEGMPVVAYYGLRFAGRERFYQHGRDYSTNNTSAGLVLIAHAMREAFAAGVERFEFGPGPQDYKRRFAPDDAGLETVALARGLRGRAALMAARRRA